MFTRSPTRTEGRSFAGTLISAHTWLRSEIVRDGVVFFHRLTETAMLLDHDAIERRPELQPIQRAACASAQPQCAELCCALATATWLHAFAGRPARNPADRDSLLPETLFPFVSHFRQCQAPLGGLKFIRCSDAPTLAMVASTAPCGRLARWTHERCRRRLRGEEQRALFGLRSA